MADETNEKKVVETPLQPGETREPVLTKEEKVAAEKKAEEDEGKVQTSPGPSK